MPKLTKGIPQYRKHKQSGQAIVTLNGRDHLLGPHGTKASRVKYGRLIQEWEVNDRQQVASNENDLTNAELAARYWRFARSYYVKNGRPTQEQNGIKAALRPFLRLYGREPASTFGSLALRTVRANMLKKNWARQTINKNIDRIRRMFRWAASEELLPVENYQRLTALAGLRKGRSDAREAEPVLPIADVTVEITLCHLTATVADMVRLQRLTGMRPAELCIMRPLDIDRSGDVWTYQPESHKTQHHEKSRVVFLGPQAQEILLRYLVRDAAMHCFRPMDSEAKRRAERHAARKTPISCGTKPGDRRKRRPKRSPGDCYDVASYRRAIHRACDQAFPPPEAIARRRGETAKQWRERLTDAERQRLAEHHSATPRPCNRPGKRL